MRQRQNGCLPVIKAGDVIDVIVLHEDDSSLSLLAGDELSVLEVILTLQAGGLTGPGLAYLEERREPGDYFMEIFIILFRRFVPALEIDKSVFS